MDWPGALLHFWLLSISEPILPVLQHSTLKYGKDWRFCNRSYCSLMEQGKCAW